MVAALAQSRRALRRAVRFRVFSVGSVASTAVTGNGRQPPDSLSRGLTLSGDN